MKSRKIPINQTTTLILGVVLSIIFCKKSFSQDLYDINTIQTIKIVFAQSNWKEILDSEKDGDNNYTEAVSVTINGELFEQVGVKYKGNSSYRTENDKNPFHIELDTYIDQDYQGYRDLKLANVFYDPSFVRETVAYAIAGQYMEAPKANYANIYVNNELIGLYTNTEVINKTFVDSRFGSKDNAFFSCSPPAGAGPRVNEYPSLEYLGTAVSSYEGAYEIKSDDVDDPTVAVAHWDELIELTDILNNDINTIESVLDIDKAIWMLAFDNVLVNLDSYIGNFKQNYYLYKTDAGVFNSMVWDLNMSFGTFDRVGGDRGGALNTTQQKAEMDHFLHDEDDTFPLVSKLMAIPRYKKMYLAHFKTILTENITNSNYLTLANDYQAIVDIAVQADQNKFYTYEQFVGNIYTDYTTGRNTAVGLANLMDARGDYLEALTDFTVTQPSISNNATSNADPNVGEVIIFTTTVVNANNDAVFLGYRTKQHTPFTKVQMYDDGAHNDGDAGDNLYGVSYTVTNDFTQYYIYAENDDIGAFSPARAEHEFYTLNATYIPLPIGDLVINELMASNETTESDQDGDFDDWLELYNNTNETINLNGLYLSDNQDDLLKWKFPDGLTLSPDDYLIVWCDSDLEQEGLHADIKFSAGGENAILSYSDGTIIENITFDAQETDKGYARDPNGTGDFVIKEPTFGFDNETILSVDSFDSNFTVNYYPNPVNSVLNIENNLGKINSIKVNSITGKELFNKQYSNESLIKINLEAYAIGTYFVSVNKNTVLKIIRK